MEIELNQFKNLLNQYIKLNEEDYALVLPHLKKIELKKNEYLVQEGDYYKNLIFINSGLVQVYVNHDDKQVTLNFLKPTDFFVDIPNMLTGSTCNFNLKALENCTLLSMPYSKMLDAYKESLACANIGRLMIERAFSDYIKFNNSRKASPEESYKNFELENKEILNQIPLKVLATVIGITPESLSRLRKRRVLNG